jgi:hypothetical protein
MQRMNTSSPHRKRYNRQHRSLTIQPAWLLVAVMAWFSLLLVGATYFDSNRSNSDYGYVYGVAEGRPERVNSGIKLHYGSEFAKQRYGNRVEIRCSMFRESPFFRSTITLQQEVTVPLVERIGRRAAAAGRDNARCTTQLNRTTAVTVTISGGGYQYPNRRTCIARRLPCANG